LLQHLNFIQNIGKIFIIFIELCRKRTHLSALKGSNSHEKSEKTSNVRIETEMCKWSIEEFARNLGIMTEPTLKNIRINLNNYLHTIWDIIGTIYSTSLVCWTGDYLIKGTTWCS